MEVKIYTDRMFGEEVQFQFRDTRPERGMMKDLIRNVAHMKAWEDSFGEDEFDGDCIDIGANIGICSVIYSNFYDFRNIFAFEPVSWTYEILLQNIILNGCNNIIPFRGAVDSGSHYLNIHYNHSSFASASVYLKNRKGYPRSERVWAFDINDVINLSKKIALLKIDCEGSELSILEHIDSFKNIQRIIVEFHPKLMKKFRHNSRYRLIVNRLERQYEIAEEEDSLGNLMLYATKEV